MLKWFIQFVSVHVCGCQGNTAKSSSSQCCCVKSYFSFDSVYAAVMGKTQTFMHTKDIHTLQDALMCVQKGMRVFAAVIELLSKVMSGKWSDVYHWFDTAIYSVCPIMTLCVFGRCEWISHRRGIRFCEVVMSVVNLILDQWQNHSVSMRHTVKAHGWIH